MRKNTRKMNFLSESVLLEESGLPFMNTIVIVTITLVIILFIVWSSLLILEENISVDAQTIVESDSEEIYFVGYVPSKDVVFIDEGARIYITIPGVTNRQKLKGVLHEVYLTPKYDTQNNAYYEIRVELDESQSRTDDIKSTLLTGMDANLKVVTGSKTMLQYLLGTLYDTGKTAFNIK